MSLNKIQLSPQQLADLYPDTLVETGAHPPSAPRPEVPAPLPDARPGAAAVAPQRFLGSNARRIAVVVEQPDYPFLPDAELQFLTNILSACRLGLADVALINASGRDPEAFPSLLEELASEKVLLFGVEPLRIGLPINFPPFQLQAFNKRTYLHGPALPELEANKPVKLQLWNSLKTLFELGT